MDSDPIRKDSLHVPPATLLALAARAEAGGDRALSDDVWRALGWTKHFEWFGVSWRAPDGHLVHDHRPSLGTRLDAVEEVPGRIVKVDVWRHRVNAWARDAAEEDHEGVAPTECLARLAAKLKALAAQKESGSGE